MQSLNKSILNIRFYGFWDNDSIIFEHYFRPSHNFLFDKYDVKIDYEKPADLVLCSLWKPAPNKNIGVPTICLVHENYTPTQQFCDGYDLTLSFTANPELKKHQRVPYWVYHAFDAYYFSNSGNSFDKWTKLFLTEQRALDGCKDYDTTRFCAFLHRKKENYRTKVVEMLSEYKKVDLGDPSSSNLTDPTEIDLMNKKLEGKEGFYRKLHFFEPRKFSFCMENSWTPGYTTEKIIDSYLAPTVPLYCGPLEVEDNFNSKAFLNMYEYDSVVPFVEDVKKLDNTPELYYSMLNEPLFTSYPDKFRADAMLSLYESVLERKDPEKITLE